MIYNPRDFRASGKDSPDRTPILASFTFPPFSKRKWDLEAAEMAGSEYCEGQPFIPISDFDIDKGQPCRKPTAMEIEIGTIRRSR